MNRHFFITLGLSSLTSFVTLASNIYPSFSQVLDVKNANIFRQLNASDTQLDSVTFLCKEIFDPASESNIPATVAWIPKRQGHVRFIGWKSQYFPLSPKERCEAVTKSFQKYYNEGRLDYLSTGKLNGYPVICTAKPGETCSEENHLFTIKREHNPNLVLQKLLNIATGKASSPIYQNSGKKLHVEVQKIFDDVPLVEVED